MLHGAVLLRQRFSNPNLFVQPTQTQFFTFGELALEAGGRLAPVTLAYETYGELNSEKSNAILVFHALSGDAHAASINGEGETGWWSDYIGPGLAFDTDRYFVICSNVIGGCRGSTGPESIDNLTGKRYAMNFPIITIGDMVRAQKRLLDHLGIEKLHAAAGGSMGAMQALHWSVVFPEAMQKLICIATSPHHSPQQIAWNEIGRRAIMADPDWNGGEWYDELPPAAGLSVARMIGHITYLSEESLESKFARRLQDKSSFSYNFETEFEIESYLRHQGSKFVERFDANSYLYITRALDYFDLSDGFNSLQAAFERSKAEFLFISFSSDWLYPPRRMAEMADAANAAGRRADYHCIETPHGHDSFLLPNTTHAKIIQRFLAD